MQQEAAAFFWALAIVAVLAGVILWLPVRTWVRYDYRDGRHALRGEVRWLGGLFRHGFEVPAARAGGRPPALLSEGLAEGVEAVDLEARGELEAEFAGDVHQLRRWERLIRRVLRVLEAPGWEPLARPARRLRRLVNRYAVYLPAAGFMLANTRVASLTWDTELGTGDAASTAQATGALWAAKGSLVAVLRNLDRRPRHLRLSVHPRFDRRTLGIRAQGILEQRTVHLIGAGALTLYFTWRRQLRGWLRSAVAPTRARRPSRAEPRA